MGCSLLSPVDIRLPRPLTGPDINRPRGVGSHSDPSTTGGSKCSCADLAFIGYGRQTGRSSRVEKVKLGSWVGTGKLRSERKRYPPAHPRGLNLVD